MLYDVTTLYFEAENEDDLRKVGYSKERRVDPQIVVGWLVDRTGFPLEISCFEGSTAETTTIVPIIEAFQKSHDLGGVPMVIAADAGMLVLDEPESSDEAGFSFVVGSRMTKAPGDLASHFRWHGESFDDGQIIDTVTRRRRCDGGQQRQSQSRTGSGLLPRIRRRGGRSGSTKPPGPAATRRPSTPKRPVRKLLWPVTNKPRSPGSSPSAAITAPSMKPASHAPAGWWG